MYLDFVESYATGRWVPSSRGFTMAIYASLYGVTLTRRGQRRKLRRVYVKLRAQGPRWLRKLAHEKGRRMFAPRYGCVQPRLIRQVMRFSASFIRSGDGETRDSQTCRRVHAAMLDKRHSRSWNWSTRPSEDSSWNIMSTQRGICKKEIGFDGSYSRRKEEFWSSFAQAPNLPLHASSRRDIPSWLNAS